MQLYYYRDFITATGKTAAEVYNFLPMMPAILNRYGNNGLQDYHKDDVWNIVMPLNHPAKDTKSLKIRKRNEEQGIFSHLSNLTEGVATNVIFLAFHLKVI